MLFKENKVDNPESLLSVPQSISNVEEPFQRNDIVYKNLSQKYEIKADDDKSIQYCKMYSARLNKMKPLIIKKINEKWSDAKILELHELEENDSECVIIGTLFKRQVLKPSILKEIAEENQLQPQPVLEKFTSETDDIILEDELQRIQLTGNIDTQNLVTGIVCGVKGKEDETGKFNVKDVCFAQLPIPLSINTNIIDDRYILFVSGLELNNCTDSLLPMELLVDYIVGHLGQPSEQKAISNIVRVIIAGNSISGSKGEVKLSEKVKLMKEFDNILVQLASVCQVDVMPGEFDPANHVMPQQSLHKCMLPMSSQYNTLQNVTNPYEFELGNRFIIGTSGQNVRDVGQNSTLDDTIEILQKLCQWGHIAPTAPDTLVSHPYVHSEPFVMDISPDIVFAANQNSFSFKISEEYSKPCLLLSIPKFSKTGISVLVNLRTLETQPLHFSIENDEF